MSRRRRAARGFSLLEVVVALSILSISLVVLLQAQSQSLASAGRSRELSVATLLARSKMIDLEQKQFHDGFSMGTQEDDGTFADDGFPDIKWKTKVSEVKLDLSALEGMCADRAQKLGPGGGGSGDKAGNDCASAMTNLTGQVGGVMDELSRSMRAAEVVVSWADGRYSERFSLRALLTRDDFQTEQETQMMRGGGQMQPGGAGAAGNTGTTAPTATGAGATGTTPGTSP